MSSLLAGAIGAGINLAGTMLNNYHNTQQARERNREALEQWNRENAYNHPANMVARMREAGLNPALMYSNGVGDLTAANSPELMASQGEAPQVDPLLAAQIRNLDADSQQKLAEARDKGVDTDLKSFQRSVNEYIKATGGIQTLAESLVNEAETKSTVGAYESAKAALGLFLMSDYVGTDGIILGHDGHGNPVHMPQNLYENLRKAYGKSIAHEIREYDLFNDYADALEKEYKNRGDEANLDSIVLDALTSLANSNKWYSKPLSVLLLKLHRGELHVPALNFSSHKSTFLNNIIK